MPDEIDIFSRRQAITRIEDTFPADCFEPMRSHVGRALLAQAISEHTVGGWRDQPMAILARYAELCVAEARRREANIERNRQSGLGS